MSSKKNKIIDHGNRKNTKRARRLYRASEAAQLAYYPRLLDRYIRTRLR